MKPAFAFLLPAALGAAPVDFVREVQPLLEKNCYECHSHASGKARGGLVLDSRGGWKAGGTHGLVIEPGRPDESPLIKAVSHADADLRMPPKKKLGAAEIALLTEWVLAGAPDPREEPPMTARGINLEEGRRHWAFQPIPGSGDVPVPAEHLRGAGGASVPWIIHNPIDAFIAAKLKERGLTQASRADPRALIRRASFDLIGMPPTFEEVEEFAAASMINPTAEFRNLLDRLLSDPRYGQRWGRHWLDVARYADTIEQSVDGERRIPFAHTYRDYVIDALNADKPFDRFILEQIAADRLPDATPADLRALGFLWCRTEVLCECRRPRAAGGRPD